MGTAYLLIVGMVLPLILVLSAFGVWRSLITHPWGFIVVALILSYFLMAATIVYALQGVGIAGDPNRTAPMFGPVERRMALLFLVYVVVTFAALFGITFLFRKA